MSGLSVGSPSKGIVEVRSCRWSYSVGDGAAIDKTLAWALEAHTGAFRVKLTLERQPLWCFYVAGAVVGLAVSVAAGHGREGFAETCLSS